MVVVVLPTELQVWHPAGQGLHTPLSTGANLAGQAVQVPLLQSEQLTYPQETTTG